MIQKPPLQKKFHKDPQPKTAHKEKDNNKAQEKFALLEAEIEKYKALLAKALADYDNLQKRTQRDVEQIVFNRISEVSKGLLELNDNAIRALNEENKVTQDWIDGVSSILNSLDTTLTDLGLTEISAKPGDLFRPGEHEAVSVVEAKTIKDNQLQPGQIYAVLQKGYMLEQRIVRPTKVAVTK